MVLISDGNSHMKETPLFGGKIRFVPAIDLIECFKLLRAPLFLSYHINKYSASRTH